MDFASVYLDTATPHGVTLGRGRGKRWALRPGSGGEGTAVIDRVLAGRGLNDPTVASRFLAPDLKHLHRPELLPGSRAAVKRLLEAIDRHEQVVIYGDYDVDGVTATAIMYRTLRHLAEHLGKPCDVRTYVPHRVDEGYGLNVAAIESLAAHGAKVIVTVDCGVTAVKPAEAAAAAGVDLIVTDHHNPPTAGDLPAACAIVHPGLPGSTYPRSSLCGAAVAFKLAWLLCTTVQGERTRPQTRQLLMDLLALAALGTIADVVPLGGPGGEGDENRILASFGLTRIRTSPFAGLIALCEAARLTNERVNEWDVGFRLAPRLNACGRMEHAARAVELLVTDDADVADQIASELEAANARRVETQARIVEQAIEMVERDSMATDDRRAIVLEHPDWHAGVVGICCSKLVERYGRPVVMMQTSEVDGQRVCHGSGRSIDGYSLHAGLSSCSDLLRRWGGHDMAAGLTLDHANVPLLRDGLIAHANAHIALDMLMPLCWVDAVVDPADGDTVGTDTIRQFEQLKPFGRGNPGVKVLIRRATIESVRAFGKGGQHAELLVKLNAPTLFPVVAWGEAQALIHQPKSRLTRGQLVDLLIEPRLDTYGVPRAAGTLIDLRDAKP